MRDIATVRKTKSPAHDLTEEVPASSAIAISRPDRIGDVIISTACLEPVRKTFREAEIYFLASEQLRPLLENHPLLAGFVSLSSDLTSELEKIRPAAIVHLHPNAECYRAAFNAGIPIRIGYSERGQDHYLTHAITDRRAEGLQHEAEYCFDLLQEIGVEKPAKLAPSVQLAEADKRSLKSKLPWDLETTAFAVINASAYAAKKEWPYHRFTAVADKLRGEFNLEIVFVGTHSLRKAVPDYPDLSGKTTLGELGWLLKYSRALLSNDTGTAHLAAAVGCPSVIIFGRTDPRYGPARWRPLSDRATIVTSPASRKRFETTRAYWRRSFAAIEVETVMAPLRNILKNLSTDI